MAEEVKTAGTDPALVGAKAEVVFGSPMPPEKNPLAPKPVFGERGKSKTLNVPPVQVEDHPDL